MKKLLILVVCATLAGGCMPFYNARKAKNPAGAANSKASTDLSAEAKLAEKLPVVTPESVNEQNAWAKSKDMQDELMRDAHRGDAARNVADARK